ncbi:MAG: SUMF1/EgtB/PvdO family nonheme iron enzyme [Pseudomonadota bacterium]
MPGARLCSDQEWERAARGADSRRYPHGNALAASDACTLLAFANQRGLAVPCPVGTHPASRSVFGVDDLVGNVMEWTATSPADDPSQAIARSSRFFEEDNAFHWIANVGNCPTSTPVYVPGIRVCASFPLASSRAAVP